MFHFHGVIQKTGSFFLRHGVYYASFYFDVYMYT